MNRVGALSKPNSLSSQKKILTISRPMWRQEIDNMSMRSQVYEWANLAPSGQTSTLRRTTSDLPVVLPANRELAVSYTHLTLPTILLV